MGATKPSARRSSHVSVVGIALVVLALLAPPAKAAPVTITGHETRLEVNTSNFVKILADGIFITAIPPARLEFGSAPAAVFPVTGGLFDVENTLAAVTLGGGLRLEKSSIGMTVDTTNLTIQCTALTGCRLLGTASQVLPNEVAEIVNVVTTDDEAGTITLTGRAIIGQATSIALNTLFQTTVFQPGFEFGIIRATLTYDVATQADAYVRPKGATPTRVSLVPAYQECIAANREHGPPLDSPSCNPPAQSSPNVTVGSPDANGAPANAVASARYGVIVGAPATPADEADVSITVSATDIRSSGDLSDYAGELQAQVAVRITDRNNSVLPPIFPDDQRGTVQATTLSVTVPCAATANSTVGSTCAITTTADTLVPGTVTEGDRSVWGFDRVRLFDGGLDEDADTTPDNMLLATQGVFIP